ncbi:MAG TPA: response regulator [Alphaproteobacteria bacterium]|nr:response regulator [Alphaproteobacteria bacterium]
MLSSRKPVTGRADSPQQAVLVVDDDPLQRSEIVDFLIRQGIAVVSAQNGFAAVHEIRRLRPAVVVMDMKMPGLDGIHVARLIQDMQSKPKVILVSGFPEYVYRAHQEDLGVFAIVEKPVPLAVLARFIREALAKGDV